MIFELFVLGKIKSGNSNSSGTNIFEIRKQLDGQLRRLWETEPLKLIDSLINFGVQLFDFTLERGEVGAAGFVGDAFHPVADER